MAQLSEAYWGAYPTVHAARVRSRFAINKLSRALSKTIAGSSLLRDRIRTLGVSGSLGRWELLEHSDCDLLVVFYDGQPTDDEAARQVMQKLGANLYLQGFPMPKPTGIYATPCTIAQLCNHADLGVIDENMNNFGKRIQFLLDTRPIYKLQEFDAAQRAILERYATGFVGLDPTKEWVYLLNDLIRYFRSYCVWRQFDFTAPGNWYARNAKLRHSRLLMYIALLFLLGECSREQTDKIAWLQKHLNRPALDRLRSLYQSYNDPHFDRIAESYETFLSILSNDTQRQTLSETEVHSVEELHTQNFPLYNELHESSSQLMKEALRFLFARRDDWSESFFEYLVF